MTETPLGALHTLFRIFDVSGDQLTTPAWRVCSSVVFVQMLSANQRKFLEAQSTGTATSDNRLLEDWNETAIILVEGLSKVFAQFMQIIRVNDDFPEIWSGLLEYLKSLLERHVLLVSNAVLSGMTRMLAEIEDIEKMGTKSLYNAWHLWQDSNPGSHTDTSTGKDSNQGALFAYLDCLHQLLRLVGENMAIEQATRVIAELHSTVISENIAAYSGDIDRMTPVQKYVIDSLKTIPSRIPGVVPELIDVTARLVTLAFQNERQNRKAGPTYVALSKSAMDLLLSYVIDHIDPADVEAPIMVSRSLRSLSIPLYLKYQWRSEGKPPTTWEKATTASVAILQAFVPTIRAPSDVDLSYTSFFDEAVRISNGIIAADFSPSSSLNVADVKKGQDFDINAFSTIRSLLTAALGTRLLPDAVRRKYTQSIFEGSIIHEPHPDDLPGPGYEPLEGLRSKHIGRVQDLPPSPRSKLSYLLLDELFDLVAVHDSSPERIRLAQAAAPYLILRVGLSLKAYVLDQPLRGRMPQPSSQKKEMLYILRRFVELDLEPNAIPPVPGIASGNKNHLHRLYPLILKAMSTAWRDEEMTRALKRVLEIVGEDFGV